MRLKLTTLALALLSPMAAMAQDPAPAAAAAVDATATVAAPVAMPDVLAPAPVAPGPAAAAPVLKWDGLVDTYYLYNLTGDPSTQGPALRAFDGNANSFTLNYAKLGLSGDTDIFGFRVDLGFGNVGTIINGSSFAGSSPDPKAPVAGAVQYLGGFIAQQAYGTAKFGKLSIDAGRFVTTASAEVIESNKNWLYSRSLLFGGVPYLHTGVRANYKATDQVTAQFSVTNGTNNSDPDNNGWKTIGANVAYASGPALLALTGYFGKDGPQGNEGDMSVLVDLVGGYTVSDKLALNINVDYAKVGASNWIGASVMAKMSISERLYLAARAEYLKNKNLYGAVGEANVYEGTVMAGIPLSSNFEMRAEFRFDGSNKEIFMKGTDAKKNQATALLSALASF